MSSSRIIFLSSKPTRLVMMLLKEKKSKSAVAEVILLREPFF